MKDVEISRKNIGNEIECIFGVRDIELVIEKLVKDFN